MTVDSAYAPHIRNVQHNEEALLAACLKSCCSWRIWQGSGSPACHEPTERYPEAENGLSLPECSRASDPRSAVIVQNLYNDPNRDAERSWTFRSHQMGFETAFLHSNGWYCCDMARAKAWPRGAKAA